MSKRPASRREFHLAIICALPIEFNAVHNSLDEVWDEWDPRGVPGDENRYGAGRMGETAVVLVLLPGMGKAAAASAAANMRASYVNLECALLVGICGAVPRYNGSEIMLGDVIIGKYITTYDFGRQYPDDFRPKKAVQDIPGRLPKSLRTMITFFETETGHKQLIDTTARMLVQLQENSATQSDATGRYIYPGTKQDMLFAPQYRHRHQQASACDLCSSCSNSTDPVCSKASELSCVDLGCSNGGLLSRDRQNKRHEMEQQGDLGAQLPDIHVGGFASADTVMKSGEHRDRISSSQEVIAFEMESAGVWDEIPCIIVKGVCDYADSHKNKNWQQFASATAASTAKAIICKHLIRNNPSDVLTPSNPICHYIPFEPNDRFVGREKVIEELKTMLFLKNYKRVALFGLGGMGKTQVALHLAHHVAKKMSDYSVFWIPALSMASYEQACTGLATKLDLPMMQDDDPKQFLKSYLESNRSGKWLFILDNADDESIVCDKSNKNGVIDKYLPQNKNGRILITTRLKPIAIKMAKNIIVELRKMSYKEAHSLMEGLSIPNSISQLGEEFDSIEQSSPLIDIPNSEEDKTKFFEALCYLPLAISQATLYMIINDISASEYLKLLQNSTQDMEELMDSTYDDSTHYDPSQSAVMTTWLISFNQIRERHPAAAHILSFITWIEPKAIPRSLLPDLASAQEKTKAIGTLEGYGFLSVQKEQDTFDIHSLVHFVMHQQAFERDVDKSERTIALSHIAQVFPSDDWKNRYLWQQYLPHALRVYWDFEDINPEMHQLLGRSIGWSLRREGRMAEMVTLLEHLTTTQMSRLEENDHDRHALQEQLALAYGSNGQIKEAVSLLEHIVAIREKTLALDHPDRLTSQHALALAYQSNGQIKEAVSLLEHVVAIKEGLAQDHPSRLASQHELARVYQSNGQIKEAVSLLEYVVAIGEKTLAQDHPDRLASQQVLASAYQSNGQIKEAVILLEHIVAIEEGLAKDHPSRLASQHELARAYGSNGQIKEAVSLLEHVVAIREKTLAQDHPDRLASQQVLASEYRSNGQIKEAVSLLEHVVAIIEKTLAQDHPNRLSSQHELARVYQSNGQIKEAVSLLEHIVAIGEKTLAQDHPNQLASQQVLASAYQSNGQIKEAVSLLEHIVPIIEKTLAQDHPDRLASQYTLASVYQSNGQIKEAVSLLEHIVAIIEKTRAQDHPDRLASQQLLASAYQSNGQIKEAVSLLEYVVAIGEKTLAQDHPDRLALQHNLASAYQSNGQIKEAVSLLEYVVAIGEKTLAQDHPDQLASQHELASAYRSNGQIKEAVSLLEHVVAIREKTLAQDHPHRLVSQRQLISTRKALLNLASS